MEQVPDVLLEVGFALEIGGPTLSRQVQVSLGVVKLLLLTTYLRVLVLKSLWMLWSGIQLSLCNHPLQAMAHYHTLLYSTTSN